MRTPAGLTAYFYVDGYKKQGTRVIVMRDVQYIANLAASHSAMNDAISRVVVCRTNDASCTRPVFFQDASGSGSSAYVVQEGIVNDVYGQFHQENVAPPNCLCGTKVMPPAIPVCKACTYDDAFSSLSIPAGWKVKFCKDKLFGPPCATKSGPAWLNLTNVDGVNFNDSVTSFLAERTGSKTVVFQSGDGWAGEPAADWDTSAYNATCTFHQAVTGLSYATTGTFAHAALCSSMSLLGNSGAVLSGPTDQRRESRNGDWDAGHVKYECGLNEYVAGVGQFPQGVFRSVLCKASPMNAGGTSGCETRNVAVPDDRGSTAEGDWDPGYYKAQCSAGKVVVGVSVSRTSGKAHRLLCCNK
jgi:hypothetical protein